MDHVDNRSLSELEAYRGTLYNFFAQVFMDPIPVPGDAYARKVLHGISALLSNEAEKSLGHFYFQSFFDSCTLLDYQHVQKELAIDRTFLCRGINQTAGPIPPYEALYNKNNLEPTAIFLNLLNFYQQNGFIVDKNIKERPDYIGLELAFMGELYQKEYSVINIQADYNHILHEEKRFLTDHLNWVPDYCFKVLDCAKTDFFKGIAAFLIDFMGEEKIFLETLLGTVE